VQSSPDGLSRCCTSTVSDHETKGNSSKGKSRSTRQKPADPKLGHASSRQGQPAISVAAAAASVHAKGEYVRGVVEFVDDSSATILLASGEWGKLLWTNFTKMADFSPRASAGDGRPLPLAVGDKIWASVLRVPTDIERSTDARVLLSTAGLEVGETR